MFEASSGMGTRAVLRCNLEPFSYGKDLWLATHWDGMDVGNTLAEYLKVEFAREHERNKDLKLRDLGGSIQKACVKTAGEHHMDAASVDGEALFNQQYGDFAEYEWRLKPNTNKNCVVIEHRKLSGEWKGSSAKNNFKSTLKVCTNK